MENKNSENKKLEKLVVTMYAESQIHAGKGMDVGIVDLPIQRERTTGFPIIQGIKGSLKIKSSIRKRNRSTHFWQ